MPAFLVTYRATRSQVCDDLETMLTGFGAVPLGECVWGLEIDLDAQELRDWLESKLNIEASATVIQLRPSLGEISSVITPPAASWLARTSGRKNH